MKTDSIFYRLFKTFPEIFFELIDRNPSESSVYKFSSVELKQTAFRIDGLFLPTVNRLEYPIFFLEVQFQKDPEFYARFFCEIFLYLRLYAPTQAWQSVVIFARRSLEPTKVEPYRGLLELPQVTRLYLDQLNDVDDQSLGIGVVKLIVETKKRTPKRVKQLVEKARSEVVDERLQQEVLDLIGTIVLYKLPSISRQEFAKMFTRDDLRKTRYYQELREEVKQEVKEEVRQEVKEEVKQEVKEEVKQEVKEEVKQEVKEEVKQEVKEEVKQEVKQEVKEEVRQEAKEEVRQAEALALIVRLLSRRVSPLKPGLRTRIQQLTIVQLENLAEALLDISGEADLVAWLRQATNQPELD